MAVRLVTTEERRARLAHRHRLAPDARTDDPVAIADSVVALHASDPVTVYLSALARMVDPSLAAVDHALYGARSLVRHHAMRRTLWVMGREVARWAHASSTRRIAAAQARRTIDLLAAGGIGPDAEAWLDRARTEVLAALHDLGPATTRELGEAVPDLRRPLVVGAGTRNAVTVAAHTRVLQQLGFEGAVVRTRPTGTWVNAEYRWAVMDDWAPGVVTALDERPAAARLLERWLRVFGPGTTDDLRWWTGWTVATLRRALADAGAVEVRLDGGGAGWLAPDDVDGGADPEPWVALLPGLDPTTMGWKERAWYLDPAFTAALFDRNGNAGPTVWVDGRVVGGWVQRPDGTLAVHLLADVGREHRQAVDAAAHVLEAALGPARFSPRFPAPLQRAAPGRP